MEPLINDSPPTERRLGHTQAHPVKEDTSEVFFAKMWRWKFPLFVGTVQVALVILFVFFAEYDDLAMGTYNATASKGGSGATLHKTYPMFQDVNVMIFIGFGFLMTFLKKYGYGSLGFNFLLSAIAIQWSTLVSGFIHGHGHVTVNIITMVFADFAAGSVLISLGVVLGRLSTIQYILMALIHIPIYTANEYLCAEVFKISDVGGSLIIHAFGAYFGLGVSWALYRKVIHEDDEDESSYTSDLFSMIGTIFLWMYWPSFNSATATGDAAQYRAVIHTFYSLAACCVTTFLASSLFNKSGKLTMEHIQNATLAGGVAIGTSANFVLQPWGSILVGMAAGVLSTFGFRYLKPLLENKLKLRDTCGVHNLHGIPAILATIAAASSASLASVDNYGYSLYQIFPERAPPANSSELAHINHVLHDHLEGGSNRTASDQAWYQLLSMVTTIAIALVGGVITGLILRIPIWSQPKGIEENNDMLFWEVPGGFGHAGNVLVVGHSHAEKTDASKI